MPPLSSTIASAFEDVNQLILENLRSDVSLVEDIGQYIIDAGGKRLRPRLCLLTAAALGNITAAHNAFATVIEFLHTATLLHDDVVDVSTLRRGRATANAAFGNAPSVLVGDFIYSRAFQLLVSINDMRVLSDIANTTNRIAEGEVLQLVRAGDANTSEAQYYEVIKAKTAALFGAACYGSALLSGAPEQTCTQMRSFGLNLGVAFQIVDDLLDYQGDASTMGKNVGDDLAEGKPTLPLIYALEHLPARDANMVRQALENKDKTHIAAVIDLINSSGAIRYCEQQANHFQHQAEQAIQILPDSDAKQTLLTLCSQAVKRAA